MIRSVPVTRPTEIPALVARARAAQPAWEALGYEGRGRILKRAQKWLLEHADEVADTIVGRNRQGARGRTARRGRLRRERARLLAAQGAEMARRREGPHAATHSCSAAGWSSATGAIGVVGVIGPWNYPLVNSVGDAIPALAAGNAVVVKPSEVTPLTSLLFERGLRESGLPDGRLPGRGRPRARPARR